MTLHADFFASSDRLEKIVKATLKRNVDRPVVDATGYDEAQVPPGQREALAFLVEQMCFTEAVSGRNLSALAKSTPNMHLRAAYAAQMQDERAHGALLAGYLRDRLGVVDVSAHWANSVGALLGEVAQLHPLAGVSAVTMSIEFYAATLLDDLVEVIKEPHLLAIFHHIRIDETRHKALAAEAVHVLRTQGIGDGLVDRAFVAAARRGADVWFKHVYGNALQRAAATLGVQSADVYARARDEMDRALAEAVAG